MHSDNANDLRVAKEETQILRDYGSELVKELSKITEILDSAAVAIHAVGITIETLSTNYGENISAVQSTKEIQMHRIAAIAARRIKELEKKFR